MKHFNLKSLVLRKKILLVLFLFLFVLGCDKKVDSLYKGVTVSEAKSFIVASTTKGDVENSKISRKYSIYKIGKFLDWTSARWISISENSALIVKVEERNLKFAHDVGVNRFVVFYREKNHIVMRIVEIIDYSREINQQEILSLTDRVVSGFFGGNPNQINEQGVQVNCYDKDYKRIDGISNIKSRQVLGGKFFGEMSRNGTLSNAGIAASSTMEDCLVWGVYLVTRDLEGNVISEVLLYTFTTGNCSDLSIYEFVTPDVGGSTAIEVEDTRKFIVEILNQLQSPCFQNAFNKITDQQYTGRAGDIFDYDMAKLLTERYGISSLYDLKLSEGTIAADPMTGRSPDGITTQGGTVTFVKMNTNLLQSNASQEYVIATFLHEFTHALMNAKAPPGNTDRNFVNNFEHEQMAEDYINTFANLMKKHFPSMSTVEARELAWGGLEKTNAYRLLDESKKQLIYSTNYLHKTGGAGTPCN
jgi:hypothetical protein